MVDRVPIEMAPVVGNVQYLRTKRDKMGHILHHQDLRFGSEGEEQVDDEAPHGAPPHGETPIPDQEQPL